MCISTGCILDCTALYVLISLFWPGCFDRNGVLHALKAHSHLAPGTFLNTNKKTTLRASSCLICAWFEM